MGPETGAASPVEGISPLNFVYSCSYCSSTFADVYADHNETVGGLSDRINPKDRIVTRMFLATCCHVFCSKHIEGRGPPFHAAGQRPQAPCPVCSEEKGDPEPRDLYSIRGFGPNQSDPQIPASWFTAPPVKLDGGGREMEALRFQYLALTRYCQKTYATRHPTEDMLKATQRELELVQNRAAEVHGQWRELQKENDKLKLELIPMDTLKEEVRQLKLHERQFEHFRSLQVNPRDLEIFVTNKAEIQHYLKIVPMLHEQNERMKARLASLGFAMALEPIPNLKSQKSSASVSNEIDSSQQPRAQTASSHKTLSSRTVEQATHSSVNPIDSTNSPLIHPPRKRLRVDSPLPNEMQIGPPSSRDAMPPPPRPLLKKPSSSKMFPSLRQKIFRNRDGHDFQDSPKAKQSPYDTSSGDVNSLDGNACGDTSRPDMSGALPAGRSDDDESRLLTPGIINDDGSNFIFRASSPFKQSLPTNRSTSKQLPNEPSYLRLMDGLSQDQPLELNLQDPRNVSTSEHVSIDGQYQQVFGRPYKYLDQSQHTRSLGRSNGIGLGFGPTTPRQYNSSAQPSTPAPQRQHQQVDRVVSSPFFDSNRRQTPSYFAPVAEPQNSSTSSGVYQSKRLTIRDPRQNWPESRSLNALSFFDSPMNARNEPIQRSYVPQPAPTNSRHVSRPNSFLEKLNLGQSYTQGAARQRDSYSSSTNGYSRPHAPTTDYAAFRSARGGDNVARMSNSMSHQTPKRVKQPWETLQRASATSKRRVISSAIGHAPLYPSSSRGVYSIAGRWRVNS